MITRCKLHLLSLRVQVLVPLWRSTTVANALGCFESLRLAPRSDHRAIKNKWIASYYRVTRDGK